MVLHNSQNKNRKRHHLSELLCVAFPSNKALSFSMCTFLAHSMVKLSFSSIMLIILLIGVCVLRCSNAENDPLINLLVFQNKKLMTAVETLQVGTIL